MANFKADKTSDAAPTQEIAQDLDALHNLAARFRHLAPTAQDKVLRAILGKREALLESISARLSQASQAAAEDEQAATGAAIAGSQRAAFAATLAEVAAMDREAEGALRKRADGTIAEIEKLRAGKQWRQHNPQ